MTNLFGKQILVIDDNEVNLDIAVETLTGCGAVVDSATGGEQALGFIAEKKYAVILLDLTMPGMDGITVGRAIRSSERNGETVVLLFSAVDSAEAAHAVRELNAKGLISKPVDVDDLARIVALHA